LIKKSADKKMSRNGQFDDEIFLSYNLDNKDYVQRLYDKLCNLKLKVWIDDKKLDNTSLNLQLANRIKNSQVFMCCITKKYSESQNCQNELLFAIKENKPIIILMFEHFDKISIEIQFQINKNGR